MTVAHAFDLPTGLPSKALKWMLSKFAWHSRRSPREAIFVPGWRIKMIYMENPMVFTR